MHKNCGGWIVTMRGTDRITCWLQCMRCGRTWK